ncbi:MAG: type I DNA topoisomerase [Chitinophagaceae bacterium]|nr:type I DNA topoisomerase [Chitinophagaceae bacterium]
MTKKNLLIVESPAKAKTIEKILGSDFTVKSCFGHIRDLEKDDMGIDVQHGFKPRYKVPAEKQKVVKELKESSKKAEQVWLASDEDREGESISWHLAEVLGLDLNKTPRIVFHEITKPAILNAIQNPRRVDMNLVNSQQARRVLDRLVGFELSPVLWRKIGMQGGLSAGRVQSVAVRLIVEREREINQFVSSAAFKIEASFTSPTDEKHIIFKAEDGKSYTEQEAQKFLEECKGSEYTVADLQVKSGKRSPAAPFTTSTLQQEASRKLGYGVSRTMQIAQKLYESGLITYMRTDSVNLSQTARGQIKGAIGKNYGEKYIQERYFKNKNESAQEAHEAIRPTNMAFDKIDDPQSARLYELIWKRTIASQMSDAETEKTIAKINVSRNNTELTASGEVLVFDGFLKVYYESHDEDEDDKSIAGIESRLPNLQKGQKLNFISMAANEKFNRHAPRYTEASLVKKLEELGIGRPSTYAPTITTIMKRNYVEKRDKDGVSREVASLVLDNKGAITRKVHTENTGAEKAKLFPTDLGFVVTDFLNQYFERVMDYSFTANIEEEFDKIAEGKVAWNEMVAEFYKPFHQSVAHTLETAERAKGERELGTDPISNKPVYARMGRYGAMVQIGTSEDEEKPRFAKLKPSQSIETISLNEALDLFKLPLTLGEWEGAEVAVNVGRFGPYVKWGEQFVSLPKGKDPMEVDLEEAIGFIRKKQEENAPIAEYQGLPVTQGKGRFGPFIKWNDTFINIPRAYDPDNLSQEDISELIEKKIEKEANKFIQNWPEAKISIENARWGPIFKAGKKIVKIPAKADGSKYTPEELKGLELEQVKNLIMQQDPTALGKKTTSKKATTKKASTKKAAPKKAVKAGKSAK